MKQTPKKEKQKKSEITKRRIIRSFLEITKKKGNEKTTIRDICREANVSVGTFYKYFRTKNDIYFAIYEPADNYFTNTVKKRIKGDSAIEKVVDFSRYYAKLNVDTGLENVKKLYNPDNSWFLKRRPMHRILEKIIKNGQESGELSDEMKAGEMVEFLFVIMRGCCYNWCTLNGSYNLETQMVKYIKRVMPGLR